MIVTINFEHPVDYGNLIESRLICNPKKGTKTSMVLNFFFCHYPLSAVFESLFFSNPIEFEFVGFHL